VCQEPLPRKGLVKPSQGRVTDDLIKVHEYKLIDKTSLFGLQEIGFWLKRGALEEFPWAFAS
jgi:hypothetical protein